MIPARSSSSRRVLSTLSLVMINIIAVDNLRSLSISATYGLSLFSFYLLAALLFFIPSILVTAELATAWPNTGGVYIWVREAFGLRWSFLTIWLQWIYNIVWYPTIFSFIATALAYLIDPALAQNKWYIFGTTLSLFWLVTALNYLGLKITETKKLIARMEEQDWLISAGASFGLRDSLFRFWAAEYLAPACAGQLADEKIRRSRWTRRLGQIYESCFEADTGKIASHLESLLKLFRTEALILDGRKISTVHFHEVVCSTLSEGQHRGGSCSLT